jgi:hypothetical protein
LYCLDVNIRPYFIVNFILAIIKKGSYSFVRADSIIKGTRRLRRSLAMRSFRRDSIGLLSYLIDIHLISLFDNRLIKGEFANRGIEISFFIHKKVGLTFKKYLTEKNPLPPFRS